MPAFLAPYAAKLAGSLIGWLVILGIIGALAGLWQWERHDRIAAEKSEAAALKQADLAQQDAQRWHDASDLRDKAIEQVKGAYKLQTEKVQEGRTREAELARSLDEAERKNGTLQADNDRLSREADAEAAKTPGDVRDLGPIVSKRVGALFPK